MPQLVVKRFDQLRLGDDRTPGFADEGTICEVEAVLEQRENFGKDVMIESVDWRRSSDRPLLVAGQSEIHPGREGI